MKAARLNWSRLGISRKFKLSFSLLLFLMLLIIVTAYFSFWSIRGAERNIRKTSQIEMHVLEMDRGMERARRLLDDFFLYYPAIGLQNAHEQYAQPSVRQIAEVIAISSKLDKELLVSPLSDSSNAGQINMNLYLASARRFADISIQAIELVSRRAAPERGAQAQIRAISLKLTGELKEFHDLVDIHAQASSFYKDYLISRQRFSMQSTFNILDLLQDALEQKADVQLEKKNSINSLLDSHRVSAHELLAIDLRLAGTMRDFAIQEQIVTPISIELVVAAKLQLEKARQQIDTVYRLAGFIIFAIALLSVMVIFFINRVLHNTITRNILNLSQVASEFGKDNLEVRAREEGLDEVGQLSRVFNTMASRLQDFVNNLEEKVALRTAELAESEASFRDLVSDLPKIAVQGYDRQRRVVYWNRASEALYGYSKEEALGRKLEDLIIPELMQKIVIAAIDQFYTNNKEIPAAELTLRHKDGSDVSVYSSHAMQVSSQGETTMYCIDVDLAELKQAQEKEQRTESIYRQLFDHSSSGVAVYEAVDNGQDFIFTDWNYAAEKIDNISREKLLGRRVTDVFPGMEEFGLLQVFQQVWQTGKPALHPVSLYKDQQLQGWRENRVYKLPTGEIVSVYDDITRQKQLEEENQAIELRLQQSQKMEAIGLMAGGVAHDLNNILTGITGYPELILLQLSADSDLRKPIEAIRESGERAAAVVADLLTVARGVATHKTVANMNTMVMEYLDSPECRHLHSLYHHIKCSQQLGEDLPDMLCSPVHIKKSIMNLVLNAAEAINTAGTITLSTASLVPDQQWALDKGLEQTRYIVLTVADTGTGIPRESIDHIFEPFYSKKVLGRSGTGLGLAVVWNTVDEHEGKVFVESSDKGTRFQLYFPARKEKAILPAPTDTTENLDGNNESVLIVDDEPHLRDIGSRMLGLLGYKVDQVSSGESAVDFVKNNPVDLILLDMLMEPGMNGRQTYEEIIKLHPEQKAVIASGFSESADVKAALQLGANGFIKKPYSMEQLGRAVKEALIV